ncbi:MAG: SPOR domain-containing protein [Bryobacteraceae bacterium]|jgi:cell division septation protein DedD
MKNNETGEFELVVGNRQLLSGFFVAVLLLAVAFAMGYVVGQNSPRSGKTADTASGGSPAMDRPQPTAAAAPAAAPAEQPAAPAEQAAAPPPAEDNQPQPAQPSTQPAASAAQPPPARQAPAELQPGTCWQVMSVGQSDAEVVVRALKDKGFPAFTTPGPNNLTRILVGPYDNTQAMAHAKTELESAGFHPIRK